MAETDILNCRQGYDPQYRDSINPNYGWSAQRTSSLAVAKAAGGYPYARETGNGGRSFPMTWTRRNMTVKNVLKQFNERFEADFFTLIDWDDSGRQYVGRFTDFKQVYEANGRWTTTATFEELPGTPMLQYPANWDSWAVQLAPFDGWGNLRCAVVGNWSRPGPVTEDDGTIVTPNALQDLAPAVGDAVTLEYRGYGLRLWGVHPGGASVAIDGGAATVLNITAEPDVLYENAAISLDIHRVVVTMAAGSGNGLTLNSFEVMR